MSFANDDDEINYAELERLANRLQLRLDGVEAALTEGADVTKAEVQLQTYAAVEAKSQELDKRIWVWGGALAAIFGLALAVVIVLFDQRAETALQRADCLAHSVRVSQVAGTLDRTAQQRLAADQNAAIEDTDHAAVIPDLRAAFDRFQAAYRYDAKLRASAPINKC